MFMTKKTRRRYSDEFKAEAVNMVRVEGYAVSEAAVLDLYESPAARERAAPAYQCHDMQDLDPGHFILALVAQQYDCRRAPTHPSRTSLLPPTAAVCLQAGLNNGPGFSGNHRSRP